MVYVGPIFNEKIDKSKKVQGVGLKFAKTYIHTFLQKKTPRFFFFFVSVPNPTFKKKLAITYACSLQYSTSY